ELIAKSKSAAPRELPQWATVPPPTRATRHRTPQKRWCPWRDSNPHSLRNAILSRARLPFRHTGQGGIYSCARRCPQNENRCAVRLLERGFLVSEGPIPKPFFIAI